MNEVHLGAIDLNLLVVLDALLSERNVTRAAARLGMTQSATSHALKRLRALTGDELLVRGPAGMLPTLRAEALAEPVRRALEGLARALASPGEFDPARARARVTLGTSDYVILVLLPRVLRRLEREAPGLELRFTPLTGDPVAAVTGGVVDLAITPVRPTEDRSGVRRRELFSESFVCVVRDGHPLAGKRLTLARFTAASHALVSPRGTEGGFVDDALAELGIARRVAVAVPHFLVAPHLVATTDLVLTLARRIAELMERPLGLALLAPPPELGMLGFTMSLVWHDRTHADPARRWLREVIAQEAAAGGSPAPV